MNLLWNELPDPKAMGHIRERFMELEDRLSTVGSATTPAERFALYITTWMGSHAALEIGAAWGRCSALLAWAIWDRPNNCNSCDTYCIDPWAPYTDWNGQHIHVSQQEWADNVKNWGPPRQPRPIMADSVKGMERLAGFFDHFDVAFIDGLHTPEAVFKDLVQSYRIMCQDSMVFVHDVGCVPGIEGAAKTFAHTISHQATARLGNIMVLCQPRRLDFATQVLNSWGRPE